MNPMNRLRKCLKINSLSGLQRDLTPALAASKFGALVPDLSGEAPWR